MELTYKAEFESREDLNDYERDALGVFALQIRFQIEDIRTVASESLIDENIEVINNNELPTQTISHTDKLTGGDDKKCDLIYINQDSGMVVVIQNCIYNENPNKPVAESNKASDLNTAATWIFHSPIENLPQGLRSDVKKIRDLLTENSINSIEFWFVHNRQESTNVKNELSMVESTIKSALKANYSNSDVERINAIEVGQNTLESWYKALAIPILVSSGFEISISEGYTISGDDWDAFVTFVSIDWLHTTFQEYKDQLFSANVRGYLGRTKSNKNINNGIRETAKNDSQKFWVFNNGITALVNNFNLQETREEDSEEVLKVLKISGLSIVNGAQTTGAIGNLENLPDSNGKVQVRFVKCRNKETIKKIIEYNNRQNEIEPSDFRSNDQIQTRLREEFNLIPDTIYYGRRGGAEDIIRRPNRTPRTLLSLDTVAQSLAAFHQEPVIAYNKKSEIWENDSLYSQFFNEQTTAQHIVLVFSLLRAVETKKSELKHKKKSTSGLTNQETEQLNFLNQRGSHFILVAAIAKCLETFLNQSIIDTFKVSFGIISPQQAEENWKEIVNVTIPFCDQLLDVVQNSLNNSDNAISSIKQFTKMVESTKIPNRPVYDTFKTKVNIID